MRILQIAFLLSVCWCLQALRQPISDVLEIAKLSKNVTTHLLKTFALLDEDIRLSSNAPKSLRQCFLFQEFKVLKIKMDMFKAQLGSQVLDAMILYTDIQPQLKLKLEEVKEKIDFIYAKYEDMETFVDKTAPRGLTFEEFARSIVSPSNSSLQSVLNGIQDGAQGVFDTLIEILKKPGNKLFCDMHTSEQQLVLYLYNMLTLTEVKGFLMMEFSYMLLKLHNEDNFNKEIEATLERYKDRSATTLNLTIETLKVAGRDLWKCDPDKHVKNKTYIEITELLQGYIEHEENLNEQRTCNMTCENFNNVQRTTKCDDYGGQHMFCTRNRQCKGKVINCRFIADVTVCHAHVGTNRRYYYVTGSGAVAGVRKECAHTSNIKGKWFQGTWCEYCRCLCDEQGVNSDRFFNLRSSESDIDHNMVVTGLRFLKKNRIIHLQIQEAKLLPNAQLNLTTLNWKPVEDYRIDDTGVDNGQDYHTLTWEKRKFDLDDLVAEDNQLLTGVKFAMIGSHLNFQIRVTPFNFTTGRLEALKSKWKHNEVSEKNRDKLILEKMDIPIKSPDHSLPLSRNGRYLLFTPTDFNKDLEQTTVPFIDAQTVESLKPVPLSGAGVLYKGSEYFAGFIYPKITTYNYSTLFLKAHDDIL